MHPDMRDYWPSLEEQQTSQPMSMDKFVYQIEQMNLFMKLVLKIAFTHLYQDNESTSRGRQAAELYDSFFPKKQENA